MTFNPSSTIYLCNVPIDNTYKNQIYFASKDSQWVYFTSKDVKPFANYLTVRKTLADGSLQSSVKVDANIETLYGYNYMYYQNANHGTRWFYAFITKLIYINEGTTEIVFETDVWQTWFKDIEILESFVEREHSETDEVGDNLIPESFNPKIFEYTHLKAIESNSGHGYLVGCSENSKPKSWWTETFGGVEIEGAEYSGVYQGAYFFFFYNVNNLNSFLEYMQAENDDCILFITVIPMWVVENSIKGINFGDYKAPENPTEGRVTGSTKPFLKNVDITTNYLTHKFGMENGVKNNKMYTAPFMSLVITNNSDTEKVYNLEDFTDGNLVSFTICGDVCANPSVMAYPKNYKGVLENFKHGVSITEYPQCSFNTDTYKLWLNKNKASLKKDIASGLFLIGSAASAYLTGGASLGAIGATASFGANLIGNTICKTEQASHEANDVSQGSTSNNLLTGLGENTLRAYLRTIRKDEAESIDNYFTMYGYQTNKLKIPNLWKRKCFNYVKTIDVNIVGGIPHDDLQQIRAMFNNGVTFWKSTATVGDYTVDNSPMQLDG